MIELQEIPGLQMETAEGVTRATIAGPFNMPLTCEYWQEPENLEQPGNDRWRYRLGASLGDNGHVGPFSHPTEYGCKIAIRKFFVEAGCIDVPQDNSHLDEQDKVIAALTMQAWSARTGRPRVGDYVDIPGKGMHRCCHAWDHGMQTTAGGSFHISKSGGASYSGSLDPSKLWERFVDSGETRSGRFWFFHHGVSGAGRGVDVNLPCRVYRLIDVSMTEEEARVHPAAKDSAEFWGEGHTEHCRKVERLMRGEL